MVLLALRTVFVIDVWLLNLPFFKEKAFDKTFQKWSGRTSVPTVLRKAAALHSVGSRY